MAIDKSIDSAQLDADLASVADAIRTKGGTSAQLAFPSGFVSAVEAIETGAGGYAPGDFANVGNPVGAVSIQETITSGNAAGYEYGLYRRTGITSVDMGDSTYIPDHFFARSSISSLKATKVSSVAGYAFLSTSNLANIVLPALSTLSATHEFEGCGATALDMYGGNIPKYCFLDCTNLSILIIRNPSLVSLNGDSGLSSSYFGKNKSGGTLYVHSSLVNQYIQATNWSTFLGYENNRILPIEGSIYEAQYADGTLIPTA